MRHLEALISVPRFRHTWKSANDGLRTAQHDSGCKKTETEEYEHVQHRKARWLWQSRRSISDTPAETYLRQARGYIGAIPPTLAYLPPARPEHYPALIAAFALVDEIEPGVLASPCNVDAVHLTLLQANGADKAPVEKPKLVIGRPLGRPIVLAPANDLLGLAITEGIEDGLSILPGDQAWSVGSGLSSPNADTRRRGAALPRLRHYCR